MKKSLTAILATILFISCGSEEVYPITYTFDKANEVSTVILTQEADGLGLVKEINTYQSIENLGLTPFEFFTTAGSLQTFESITIDSEIELTINFGMDTPIGQFSTVPYENNEVSQLGLIIEDDIIRQRACFSLSPNPLSLQVDFCDEEDAVEAGNNLFLNSGLGVGDTLAYSIIEYEYVKE